LLNRIHVAIIVAVNAKLLAVGKCELNIADCGKFACAIAQFDIPWTLSTQSYINGLAFATGLCPIAGKYGFRYGVLVGFMSAIICAITAEMHGGFVLYNGGFNAGLTALVVIPILDFYNVKPIRESDV
jgi:hypothetical protein